MTQQLNNIHLLIIVLVSFIFVKSTLKSNSVIKEFNLVSLDEGISW